MPKEAISLMLLMEKINSGMLQTDQPLIKYQDEDGVEFPIFQNSGLNVLLGFEGSGKTKLLTQIIIDVLNKIHTGEDHLKDYNILYIDTERPEPQYAYSIKNIFDKTDMSVDEVIQRFHLLAFSDLNENEIRGAIDNHLQLFPIQKFIIIIDHILPLVAEMNDPGQASVIDQVLKRYIHQGHIVIASIHKPYNGDNKGVGHIGSSLQRLASSIFEVKNNKEGTGFTISQLKSRLASTTKINLNLFLGDDGYIDAAIKPLIELPEKIVKKTNKNELVPKIFSEFINGIIRTKKQLLEIIRNHCGYSADSPSGNSFYNDHLRNLIVFEKDTFIVTETGKKLM